MRKMKTLEIHRENKKLVRRLIEIKPHPNIIQVMKETNPEDEDESKQTKKNFVSTNKSQVHPLSLLRMQSTTPTINKN